jgi:CheY-specific phosphatase CheX
MASFDKLVIELQKGDESVASISIKKTDLDVLMNMHGHTRAQVIEDMIQTMETEVSTRTSK